METTRLRTQYYPPDRSALPNQASDEECGMSIWSDPQNDESWPHVPSRFGEIVFVD